MAKALQAPACEARREFAIMSSTVALNHATVTVPLLYASSVLTNEGGQAGNAMLYGACLLCSLGIATWVFGQLGGKRGLALAMGLYSIYVLLFAVAASICEEMSAKGSCQKGGAYELPIYLAGAFVGGTGAGILWTCQGGIFSTLCERVALCEARPLGHVTAEFAGHFAFIFLAFEGVMRALATVGSQHLGLEFHVVFYIFGGLAMLSTLCFCALATEMTQQTTNVRSCGKAMSAISLWKDPKIWLLQCTNLTFGFAAAWLGGYVNRRILTEALSSHFIGFAGAMLSALAAVLSMVLGHVASRVGKGWVLALGALAFLALGLLSQLEPAHWGSGVLVFYVLMGVGRAVYESTNKAIFADFFPGELSPGAFANVFVFGTFASTVAFTLGATSRDSIELLLLLAFAALTVPCYLLALMLKQRKAKAASEMPSV